MTLYIPGICIYFYGERWHTGSKVVWRRWNNKTGITFHVGWVQYWISIKSCLTIEHEGKVRIKTKIDGKEVERSVYRRNLTLVTEVNNSEFPESQVSDYQI